MNKIILIGATGLIGSYLSRFLFDKGYEPIIISSNIPNAINKLPFAQKFYSIEDTSNISKEMESAFAVINLAGASIGKKKWTKQYKREIYLSRINTTRKIVELINQTQNKPKVFVSASAIGYYGNTDNILLDEKSPNGNDFLANVCFHWEVESHKVAPEVRVVNPRIGVVLASHDSALQKMLLPYKFYIGGTLGSGTQWVSWIHIDDLIEQFYFCLTNDIHKAVNFTAPNPIQMKEMATSIAKSLRKPNLFTVPSFALNILMGEQAALVLNSNRVIPQVLINHSFQFKYTNIYDALISINQL